MKNKIYLCILLMFCGVTLCRAQNTIADNSITPEPQVWSFMKYGGSQPNLYIGTVNVSIPIYTYQDEDFIFPISLSYASNGYIPNLQANDAGLGWFLNAGGCITREVKGIPDEYKKDDTSDHGYYYVHQNSDNLSDAQLRNSIKTDDVYYAQYGIFENRMVETEPDIFHFNFMGHTGSFVLGPRHEIYVFNTSSPHGEYKIDISSFSKMGYKIIITSGDGYTYTFGYDENNSGRAQFNIYDIGPLEIKSTQETYTDVRNFAFYHDKWVLTEIKAPNGRTVCLEYEEGKQIENVRVAGIRDWRLNVEADEDYFNLVGTTERPYVSYRLGYITYANQLRRIIIEDQIQIDFSYTGRTPEKKYKQSGKVSILRDLKTLDKLSEIKCISLYDNSVVKQCDLRYTYGGGVDPKGNNVLLLNKVYLSGEGEYLMQYNDKDKILPCHGTISVDHWGYYNSVPKYDVAQFLIKPYIDESTNEEIMLSSDTRASHAEFAMQGMLEKLTYPTGGYTVFEYESHNYSRMVKREHWSGYIPNLIEKEDVAGGVRISKITDYASQDKIASSRTFEYKYGTASSGILLHFPRYRIILKKEQYGDRYGLVILDQSSGADLLAYNMGKTHIEYSNVREKFDDGSYVDYRFSCFSDYPDSFDTNSEAIPILASAPRVIFPELVDNFLHPIDHQEGLRGRLIETNYYNNTGDLIKRVDNIYGSTSSLKYRESMIASKISYLFHRIYVETNPLIRTEERLFPYIDDSGTVSSEPVLTIRNFKYNSYGQTSHVSQSNSDGSVISDVTYFVSDTLHIEDSGINQILRSYNMLGSPITKMRTIKKAGAAVGDVVKIDKYHYNQPVMYGWPALYAVSSSQPKLDYEENSDARYIFSYDLMDDAGRILQMTDANNVTTSFIWGYKGRYPIVKLVNATWDDVRNTLKLTTNTPYAEGILEIDLAKLRRISKAEVTAYWYLPNIGLTKISDPNGRITNYRYKQGNRIVEATPNLSVYYEYQTDKLSEISKDGDIVKRFSYSK